MIGILPTLERRHLVAEALSPDQRYVMLNEQMLRARGEPIRLDIAGDDPSGRHGVAPEHLQADFDSIAPEAACTSMQLHLQVHPDSFAGYWNAAQCLAGVQLAVGANSPFLLGSRLWAETRIPLFEQSCDVRTPELRNQGVRPRVWFGERWITSILDLFAENGRYFPALMPVTEDADPMAELRRRAGAGSRRAAAAQRHHLAVEPAGVRRRRRRAARARGEPGAAGRADRRSTWWPTRCSSTACCARWSRPSGRCGASMSFEAAEENFTTAARHGLDGPLYWPGTGWIRPDELVLRKLLPQAADGLARWGVAERGDRPLPLDHRAALRHPAHGAAWQLDTVAALEDARRRPADRAARDAEPLPGVRRRPTSPCTPGRCLRTHSLSQTA